MKKIYCRPKVEILSVNEEFPFLVVPSKDPYGDGGEIGGGSEAKENSFFAKESFSDFTEESYSEENKWEDLN
jgi:hypothetical protein